MGIKHFEFDVVDNAEAITEMLKEATKSLREDGQEIDWPTLVFVENRGNLIGTGSGKMAAKAVE